MKKLLLLMLGVISSFQLALATTCPNAQVIPASPTFPYTQSLVCGTTNDITGTNAATCGSTLYMGGLESVYTWTPTASYTNVAIAYSGQSYTGIFVWAGCPTTAGSTCIGNITSSTSSKTLTLATVTAGTTYYIMFDTWPTPVSPCTGTFTMTVPPPATPATPTQSATAPTCTAGTQLDFTTMPATCSVSAVASGNDNANTTATVNTFSCATSAITGATLNASIGTSCPSWYTYNIIVNGTTVATNQCNITGFNLTPYLPLTSVSIVSNDADAWADPVTMNLTVNLTYLVPFVAPSGVTYYWQTAANGTSTANPHTGPYSVFANGTYFVRAFATNSGQWSTNASSITVTNFPVATAPAVPTAGVNPACSATGGTTLTVPAAPTNVTYYWQTVNNGSSTANNASTALPVTTTGTYYASAFDNVTQCWSNTSSLLVTVDTYVPAAPLTTASPLNVCLGSANANVTASPAAGSGSAVVTFATNYSANAGNSSLTGTLTIPAGATVTSSSMVFNGMTTTGGAWLNDMSFAMSGGATFPATFFTGTSATNAGPFTYTPTNVANGTVTLSFNNTWTSAITIASAVLTVNYTLPNPTIEWYSANTAGSLVGTGSPYNAVGSIVLPNTLTVGNDTIYARATAGGCQSASLPFVISVTPVLATINPVNATCNGLANGSFTLGTVACGTAPFVYKVDGEPNFGPIPTDLTAGVHSIVMQDGNGLVSSPIIITITQPGAPTALAANNVTYYNALLDWTPSGLESSWLVEYGTTGFTLGTGTQVTAFADSLQLTAALSANTCYDFYVRAACDTSSIFAGPFNFCTDPGFLAWDNTCGPGFIDISGTGTQIQGITDDSSFGLTLPWAWNINGTTVNTVTIGNNGGVLFNTLNAYVGYFATGNGLFPYAQDLATITNGGIYYESIGNAPNRMYVIQWQNIAYFGSPNPANGSTFEVVVMEATGEVYYIYTDTEMGNAADNFGADAEIALNTANGSAQVSMNNAAYLTNNSCIHFYNALCPNITTFISTVTTDDATLDWNPGLYGETEWTLVYGFAGFDPTVPAQVIGTQNLVTSDASFGNSLTQLTAYDVYIYSQCTPDSLVSNGFLYNFTTLPNCSYPTNITVTTDVDSLGVNWNWLQSPVGSQISDFNVAYVMTGNNVYSGTEVATGSTLFSDTIYDASLLGGGVYQVYVQSVCSNGDTSAYAGPITVTMPLTTDTVCGAEMLNLNTIYTFNNTGATVSLDEINIAPAATGAQTTDGWINSTLNGTTWYKFVAPTSGQVRLDFTGTNYNGQAAVYDVALCSDFNNNFDFVAANDNAIGGTSLAPNFTVCGLTPGNTYFIMHDGFTGTAGTLSVKITEVVVYAGLANATSNVCAGDTLNLDNTINSFDLGGTWSAPVNAVNASIFGSTLQTAGIAFQTFNFQYEVVDGCAIDTVVSKVRIFAPSSAGEDGSITACLHEPVDLLAGLDGNVDLTGTWYDPSNAAITNSQITTGGFGGNYNYDYIAGNGVCPNDTANVVVIVDASCDFLDITEETFAGVAVYPNPTNGVVFVAASNNAGNFSYEVTDANGRVIAEAINGVTAAATTSIDLSKVEIGVYFITLSNATAKKVYRIVVQ
jgi:hypothetical protein